MWASGAQRASMEQVLSHCVLRPRVCVLFCLSKNLPSSHQVSQLNTMARKRCAQHATANDSKVQAVDLVSASADAPFFESSISSASPPPGPFSAAGLGLTTPPRVTPPPLPAQGTPTNRDKFMQVVHVQSIGCDIDAIRAGPGTRLTFRGTPVVLYPLSINPDRRYVIFMDENGVTGVTIWSPHLSKFKFDCIGAVCEITKVTLNAHQGKKSLNMSKESEVKFITNEDGRTHIPNPWWQSLLKNPVMSIIDAHTLHENCVINVSGILGFMTIEEKLVKNEVKHLLIFKIIDRTGQMEVRSWTAGISDFSRFRERPIQLKRVRVTAYSGNKMLELIDGDDGTQVEDDFPGAPDLSAFWVEPSAP